jgi:hypothetical protein
MLAVCFQLMGSKEIYFSSNVSWDISPGLPGEILGPLLGLRIDRHIQFPKHVNLKSECYFPCYL